ncbi:hypothetical protein BX666DRAFT_1864624 [Dichotomocladium elegans]|nr:hypothetical protein BX666DRAFT_1864624 [Dichotomocladium elegans]
MEEANKMLTTNNAVTHRSTNDECLDLFYQLGLSRSTELIFPLLDKAWRKNPMLTLHIIWYTRSIHRGRSSNNGFYLAFCWLLKNHPQTAIRNMPLLVEGVINVNEKSKAKRAGDDWDMLEDEYIERLKSHGYWKDLLNICMVYVEGEIEGPTNADGTFKSLNCPRQERRPWKEAQAEAKRAKREARHTRLVDLLASDPVYRSLHFTTARLFADQLRRDLEQLRSCRSSSTKISLAGKWAPTLAKSHDKSTLLATSISELLFPPAQYQDPGESRAHYLNKVRELYRKEVTTPLRAALDVTERKMSRNEWDKIDFAHVPSKCMSLNCGHFLVHAEDRFAEYMNQLTSGKTTITGATLLPHELVERCRSTDSISIPKSVQNNEKLKAKLLEMSHVVADAQWKTLVDSIRNDTKGGNLGSALAVCDMSGSMYGSSVGIDPIWPAVALSLLLAEFAAPPFNGMIITFAENPAVVQVSHLTAMHEQVEALFRSEVGYSTDFNKVFLELLLPMAIKHKLKQEDMVKRLFVFSDMEFNQGYGEEKWETNYDTIKKAYEKHGYKVPELVWWNLAAVRPGACLAPDAPKPVTKETRGCAMVAGYSGSMFKTFIEQEQIEDDNDEETNKETGEKENAEDESDAKELDPISTMKQAVEHASFSNLVLVD